MNHLGELIQKEIGRNDSILDLGCGIMAPILDTCPTYLKTRLKCKFIVGVDIFRNYLDEIKDKEGIVVVNLDIKDLTIFLNKSFDIVLLLDIVEHLEKDAAEILILEAERIARKKVIIYTPKRFSDNIEHKESFPYCVFGDNPYQGHKSYISPEWLTECSYVVSFPPPGFNTFGIKMLYQGKENPGLKLARGLMIWLEKNTAKIPFSARALKARVTSKIPCVFHKRKTRP